MMKERGEEAGWGRVGRVEGGRGGGPGGYFTILSVESYRDTFGVKNEFLPQKCPENSPPWQTWIAALCWCWLEHQHWHKSKDPICWHICWLGAYKKNFLWCKQFRTIKEIKKKLVHTFKLGDKPKSKDFTLNLHEWPWNHWSFATSRRLGLTKIAFAFEKLAYCWVLVRKRSPKFVLRQIQHYISTQTQNYCLNVSPPMSNRGHWNLNVGSPSYYFLGLGLIRWSTMPLTTLNS